MFLELQNVKKYFSPKANMFGGKGAITKAVDDVSFAIRYGETVSLVGESGCGKTTLARLIIRLYAPDGGTIIFDGQDVISAKGTALRALRQSIQMVFQDPYGSLDPRFTIYDVMSEPMNLDAKKYRTRAQKEARIFELLEAVGLGPQMLNRYPHEFSGGERQRIAIARALVVNPQMVILDEAVSSLDVLIQKQILDLLAELKTRFRLTYLFITHNLRVARTISDRVAVMRQGKIVEMGPSEQIFARPEHDYTKQLLDSALITNITKRVRP